MCFTLFSLLFYCCLSAAGGQVPSPENVTVISQDMGLILKWDPPQNSSGKNFTYTAEYKGYRSFQTVCLNDWSISCDFTDEVTAFGTYDLRVRTELEGSSSVWVVIDGISLDKITTISAPEVKLQSRKGEIEVDITDPVLRKSNLREYFHPISYRIHYWIEGEIKKEELKAQQSRIMLQNLKPKVWYCVRVKILTNKYTESPSGEVRSSLLSKETCIYNTENEEDVEPWLIVIVLLGSCVVVFVSMVLIFFACWYTYRGFRFLHPKAKLPEHFKQYLCERPKSSLILALQNSPHPEECYHEVSIIQCLEDVSQELHQAEGPKLTRPHTNISSKPEEGLRQNKPCDFEQKRDYKNTERNVTSPEDGETELLLQ